jgi:hypothetical protein
MSDYARLLEVSMCEFERGVEQQVKRAFEAARALPGDVAQVPFIGGEYDPHAPREQHSNLIRKVCRALCCQKWFEFEAPKWAQPLPLSAEDCYGRWQGPNRGSQRHYLVGQYGLRLRGTGWERRNVPPFEVHCAQMLAG